MSQQSSDMPPPFYQDDEMSLKDLLLKIGEIWQELWRNKILIIICGVVCTGLFYVKAKTTKITYTAGISFMVAENNSNEQGIQFSPYGPLDFTRVENNKITELSRSGKIIYEVLLNKAVINDKQDYLANHLIDIYRLQEKWMKEPEIETYKSLHLKDFYFSRDDIETFSQKELRALSILHGLVAGNNLLGQKGLMTVSYNDNTNMFRLNVETLNESLAMRLIETIFDELKKFYIEETIGRPQRAYKLLTVQTDSLAIVLSNAERQLAYAQDRSRGLTSTIAGLNVDKLKRDANSLSIEYTESFKNKKNLELLLTKETPEFQIIDRTFFPIENAPSALRGMILGILIGVFIASGFVVIRKVILDALSE